MNLHESKLSDLTLAGWLVTIATVIVVIVAAVATAHLVPDEWVPWARTGKHLLILPAVGIGVGFFLLARRAVNKLGWRVLRSE